MIDMLASQVRTKDGILYEVNSDNIIKNDLIDTENIIVPKVDKKNITGRLILQVSARYLIAQSLDNIPPEDTRVAIAVDIKAMHNDGAKMKVISGGELLSEENISKLHIFLAVDISDFDARKLAYEETETPCCDVIFTKEYKLTKAETMVEVFMKSKLSRGAELVYNYGYIDEFFMKSDDSERDESILAKFIFTKRLQRTLDDKLSRFNYKKSIVSLSLELIAFYDAWTDISHILLDKNARHPHGLNEIFIYFGVLIRARGVSANESYRINIRDNLNTVIENFDKNPGVFDAMHESYRFYYDKLKFIV